MKIEKQKDKLVSVAIATYNGEKFLREQLNSIYAQTHKNIEVIVCDDKSTDKTPIILDEYKKKYGLKFVMNTCKLGVIKNFEKAISLCSGDYISLSDQDDVWIPEKIEWSLNLLINLESGLAINTPAMVFTDLMIVDEHLRPQHYSLWRHLKLNPNNSSFNRLLIDNVITGCTILMNRSLVQLALPIPNGAVMHDIWLALVASYFGRVNYLTNYTVFYRQHEHNIVGANRPSVNILKKIAQLRISLLEKEILQAETFMKKYNSKLNERKIFKNTLLCFIKCSKVNFFYRSFLMLQHHLFSNAFKRTIRIMIKF